MAPENKKQKEQQALLDELVSIKILLDEDLDNKDSDDSADIIDRLPIDDIPLLEEMIVDEEELIQDNPVEDSIIEDETDDLDNDKPNSDHTTTGDTPQEETYTAPDVLPGQQSLFDKEASKSASPTPAQPTNPTREKPRGENPFLPKHIRDRLNGTVDVPIYTASHSHRQETRETPIPQTRPLAMNESKSSAHSNTQQAVSTDDIIDALVDEYLPIIEARLRERLKQKNR